MGADKPLGRWAAGPMSSGSFTGLQEEGAPRGRALGDVDGVRLLTPERLREATRPVVSGIDEVFGMPCTWALGYALGAPGGDQAHTATVFGMGGAGGSFACGDTATGTAVAITKNRLT